MKIVIDIPEERYKDIQRIAEVQLNRRTPTVEQIVANGTPLPKGHGRLKDVDWIDDNCENHYSDKDGSWCYAWRDIDNAPTIIPAESEEEK